MYKIKNDEYKKTRGSHTRILDVSCEICSAHIAFYQKDGAGILKRMYVDRFIDISPVGSDLVCPSCGRILGNLRDYKTESRPAYRLYVGAVKKKIVQARDIC